MRYVFKDAKAVMFTAEKEGQTLLKITVDGLEYVEIHLTPAQLKNLAADLTERSKKYD